MKTDKSPKILPQDRHNEVLISAWFICVNDRVTVRYVSSSFRHALSRNPGPRHSEIIVWLDSGLKHAGMTLEVLPYFEPCPDFKRFAA
jgi:hypothetical protein